MLKNRQTPSGPINEDDAQKIGILALGFLADDPELLRRFMDLSGLTVEQLRRESAHPSFFAGLLDFVLNHEPTLDAFVAHASLRPEDVEAARVALSGSFGAAPR